MADDRTFGVRRDHGKETGGYHAETLPLPGERCGRPLGHGRPDARARPTDCDDPALQ